MISRQSLLAPVFGQGLSEEHVNSLACVDVLDVSEGSNGERHSAAMVGDVSHSACLSACSVVAVRVPARYTVMPSLLQSHQRHVSVSAHVLLILRSHVHSLPLPYPESLHLDLIAILHLCFPGAHFAQTTPRILPTPLFICFPFSLPFLSLCPLFVFIAFLVYLFPDHDKPLHLLPQAMQTSRCCRTRSVIFAMHATI